MISENPITRALHDNWRKRIGEEFKDNMPPEGCDHLSFIKFIDEAPQRFYNVDAFKTYRLFLEKLFSEKPELLVDILNEHINEISISSKLLAEINRKPIHDTFFPDHDMALFDFIDREIHYNYLKVLEGPFYHFILVAAKASRVNRGKSTDKLDLFNAVEEMKNSDFSFTQKLYSNTIRNGIAHGKIIFGDTEIAYIDKKEHISIPTKDIIRKFDDLVDCVNGFALALKMFYLTKSELQKNHIKTPSSILIEELQARVNGPAWKIVNCVDSVHGPINQKQMMIYIENEFWDFNKVQFNSFYTAIMAEKLSLQYDRFFLSLKNKHAYAGWAAFDGNKLKIARESGDNNLYAGVLENNLLFFVPKFKFPKIIYKLGSISMSFKTVMPVTWKERMAKFAKPFYIREIKSHTKKYFTVVEDPSVIIRKELKENAESIVRNNYRSIINSVVKKARKDSSIFSGVRYKPVKYIRVFVYDTDLRVRKLRYSGLIEELVCTIGFNTSDQIPMIDIIGGRAEQYGKYRIVWNKKWLEKNPTKNPNGIEL